MVKISFFISLAISEALKIADYLFYYELIFCAKAYCCKGRHWYIYILLIKVHDYV
jgi:hypothetical protein